VPSSSSSEKKSTAWLTDSEQTSGSDLAGCSAYRGLRVESVTAEA
jgi:hypothetical protein